MISNCSPQVEITVVLCMYDAPSYPYTQTAYNYLVSLSAELGVQNDIIMPSWFCNNILVSLLQGGSRLVLMSIRFSFYQPQIGSQHRATSSNALSSEFCSCLYSLLMFCPDEDCSPAVETLAFDDMFVSQFCGW